MQQVGDGYYVLDVDVDHEWPDVLNYKYTRGGWDQVELDGAGDVPPNRRTKQKRGVRRDYVPHWRWYGNSFNPAFLPRLGLAQADFPVPQLQTTRRVRVLLPYDYEQSTRRYPVLYLQDGQNLIGAGSDYGSWEVDRRMAVLASRHHHEVILVAIDHAGEKRVQEFTPDVMMAGTGDGRHYLDFIVSTLKPYIDQTFRTQSTATATGLGGSSMGGLLATYGGLLYPNVFGRLLVFSPSFWAAPNLQTDIRRGQRTYPSKWYVYGGGSESRYMVSSLKQFINNLEWAGTKQSVEVQLTINPAGKHSESDWGHEFTAALEWLFY
jgi:predicted alpha/beta superfamily hydrolase